MQNLAFVGDIHNQHEKLIEVLAYYSKNTHHLVLLGDINDSLLESGDFVTTYKIVRNLVDQGLATLIQSNHQFNLTRVIRGSRKTARKSMINTLYSLQNNQFLSFEAKDGQIKYLYPTMDALDIAHWLDTRPFYFESSDKEVVGVHAQFLQQEPNFKKFRNTCLYGKRVSASSGSNQRDPWYLSYTQKPFIVCGHYHYLYESPYCAVIDAGCGSKKDAPIRVFEWPNKITRDF